MRLRFYAPVLALALFAPTVRAQETADPTVFIRFQSVTELLEKAKYLAKLAGQEDVAQQFLGIVEAMDGPQGIEGIDTKRPIGMTANLENVGPENPALVMIPIASEKDFLNLIARFTKEPKKDKDGIYPVEVPNVPVPIYFKFAQKYAFVTVQDKANLDDKKLPDAAKLLKGEPDSVASFHFRFDRLPADARNLILGQVENQVAVAKEQKMPGEPEAVRKFRLASADYFVAGLKTLLTEGKELQVGVQIDPKKDDLALKMNLSARPGTEFAKAMQAMGKAESEVLGALTAADAVGRFGVNVGLPSDLRKQLDKMVDDLIQKAVDDVPDANAAPLLEKMLNSLAPTFKAGMLDGGFGFYGPGADKKYTLLGAVKVVKGKDIEKTLKGIVSDLPAQFSDRFDFDAEKAEGVTLHEVKVGDQIGGKEAEIFGRSSVWLGTSENRLFVGFGPDAKAQIKRAAGTGPKAQPIVAAEVSVAEMAPITDPQNADKIRKVVKTVFGASPNGQDKVTATLEGGDQVTFTFKMKGKLITFGVEGQKASRKK